MKSNYLNQEIVANFVTYLANIINGTEALALANPFQQRKASADFDKKVGLTGTAQTLKVFFDCYKWRGQDYFSTAEALAHLQREIRKVHANPMIELSVVRSAVYEIMIWGLSRPAADQNMVWFDAQGDGLPGLLREAKDALESENPDLSIFSRGETPMRMNAGYTKVFSLLCDGVVIYDGRVGAALCWLVRRFLKETGHTGVVPQELAFRWSQGRSTQNRNPSGDGFTFSHLADDESWARTNLHASWILDAARLRSGANWCSGNDGLRKVEAALFMLGYGFPPESAASAMATKTVLDSIIQAGGVSYEKSHQPSLAIGTLYSGLRSATKEDFMSKRSNQDRAADEQEFFKQLISLARKLILEHQDASISFLQRHLRIGFNQAKRMHAALEGTVVTAPAADGSRQVIASNESAGTSQVDANAGQIAAFTQKHREPLMPQLIQHIDAIARACGRDVLMIALDRNGPRDEVNRLWPRSAQRQELIDWLDANGIGWKHSGWPSMEGCMESYQGGIYVDLAYDPTESLCAKLLDYVQEDAQGFLRWPGTRLYVCSLEWAQQFAYQDEPSYWAEQADRF